MSGLRQTQELKIETIYSGLVELGAIQDVSFQTAAGLKADQKVELDVMGQDKALTGLIIGELCVRAEALEPDVIIPVPKGADELGYAVARRLDVPVAYMDWISKKPGNKQVTYRSKHDRSVVANAERVLILDDVYTKGSSTNALARHKDLRQKTIVGVLVVWSRLLPEDRIEVEYPVISLVEKYVPLRRKRGKDA